MTTTDAVSPGHQFASDNCAGICAPAWEAMERANQTHAAPYGNDAWTERASNLLRELFEYPCDVYFTFNGTAANSLALASLCRSYHSVIAHEQAHVETDECGGPEFFSNGTKLLLVPGDNGKVDLEQVERTVLRRTDLHYPKPKVLSITQATEMGTVYSLDELQQIGELKRRLKLNLHMDGARFSNAVAALDVAPKEVTWQAGVDVLCFGGTKNGMAVGDCVVFFDAELAEEFSYRCKQAGQLASKMCFLSAPWVGLLEDGRWRKNGAHANAMARQLADALNALPRVEIRNDVQANALFVHFPGKVAERLRQMGWSFYDFIGIGESRLMCSWATTTQEIDTFVGHVASLLDEERGSD